VSQYIAAASIGRIVLLPVLVLTLVGLRRRSRPFTAAVDDAAEPRPGKRGQHFN